MDILLVEDHENTRWILQKLLGIWGHKVAAVETVRTGLQCLQDQHFDAIVSDIALPDGSGYELMSEARRAGVNALGIAISAYPYPPEVEEPKVTGFDHHLNKPLASPKLRSLLEEHAAAA